MSTPRHTRVVTSLEEAAANIRTYAQSVRRYEKLAARIKQHPAWYAIRDTDARWLFGPSKFIGYHQANPTDYLASYSRRDGKETEPALSAWFVQVGEDTPLGRELRSEFIRFAEQFGKSPHAHWRVSVAEEDLATERATPRADPDLSERIAFDPEICGGRARIAGTRVRVSDVVSMLAAGASRAEILADFPYLAAEDITAALEYAAKAVDHRILKAA
jgi:uncharacterized protein (DUF433 family)